MNFRPGGSTRMVPLTLFCPLAAIGITGLYAAWHRVRLGWCHGPEHAIRERVAYMLWIAATRT